MRHTTLAALIGVSLFAARQQARIDILSSRLERLINASELMARSQTTMLGKMEVSDARHAMMENAHGMVFVGNDVHVIGEPRINIGDSI